MPKQKIDIEIGSKPAGKTKGESGKSHPMPQNKGKSDVSGQDLEYRIMRCWNCEGLSYIWYDTDAYHTYICCYCHAANTL